MRNIRVPGSLATWARHLLALGLFCCVWAAQAQVPAEDPDWKESEAPPPPAFSKDHLLPLDMPRYVTLKFGVDPATLAVTPDGIIRYVMVAVNDSGSSTAMYEGLRCATGQVITYARAGSNGNWSVLQEPQWIDLNGRQPSKHALALATQGACRGNTTVSNKADDIVRALKAR
jgi:hypothetical protein